MNYCCPNGSTPTTIQDQTQVTIRLIDFCPLSNNFEDSDEDLTFILLRDKIRFKRKEKPTLLSKQAKKVYQDMALGKGGYKNLLVMKLDDSGQPPLQIDNLLSRCTTLQELIPNLPRKSPRFLFYNLKFEMPSRTSTKEGQRSILVLINWVPHETPVRDRFKAALSIQAIKSNLSALTCSFHASQPSGIDPQAMIQKVLTFLK